MALEGEGEAGALAALRRVLRHEADALHQLSATLDPVQVNNALDLLFKIGGRAIVTGMGKSGHIARKIAATLASTGTPAQFVHPAEASHGDLGMVTPRDAVIALSNSGETTELADIIGFTRRWSIPLIAITSRSDSALGSAADALLLLAPVGEAGLIGLAPPPRPR
jgi:arabinose-5-phosphate isomerase